MKASEIFKKIEEQKKHTEFLKTGFTNIDKLLDGGFLRKEIIILGAFTGIGKSFLAGQIFYNIATQGFLCGYFSLEIANEMILARLAGQISNIKPTRIMHGRLTPEEFDAKAKARAKTIVYDRGMEFYDDIYNLAQIEEKIQQDKYEFVVIDFIQNVQIGANMDEYNRLSFISIQVQRIAKEQNCCILILSQLSNKVGANNTKVVEYKGSGAIAMIADLGFFLERGDPVLGFNGEPVGNQPIKLSLRKNRRGLSGLTWNLQFVHPGGLIIQK